ncbi:MAG TPA: hypothetical protein DCL38_03640 [Lachnospiraceae bacterium]|nr:hypothetical protein [Lachnospiraceae bacterium]
MRLLVIGGTYFLGRAFVRRLLAEKQRRIQDGEEMEIVLLNRGSVSHPEGIDELIRLDRHDRAGLSESRLHGQSFDVIVDFCAYEEGDIEGLVDSLGVCFRQYIFISTCDVYRRFTGEVMDEEGELEERIYPGKEGDYIRGKVRLEAELKRVCEEAGAHFSSVRPVIIYGPGNYAPREGIYYNWIKKAGQVLEPFDADGHFQLVYVDDAAEAIRLICNNEKARDAAINVCGPQIYTWADFHRALKKAVPVRFESVYMTVNEIAEKHIGLPFPLTKQESEQYSGERITAMGLSYRSLEEGLKSGYDAFTG